MALEQTEIWMNVTPSGKAISVKLPNGDFLIAPMTVLKKMISGESQGVQLQKVIPEEKLTE